MVDSKKPIWVVAVSGGIDSIVLLDILHKHSQVQLIVAHVDHGIRDDGDLDLQVVRSHTDRLDIPLETIKLELGKKRDEASARIARYAWLETIRQKYAADAVVTAHHQDDVIETIIINHIRGTGWKGICSLRSHHTMVRPLVHMSKARIIAYALAHHLEWREDSTNEDSRYLRNAVRQLVVPRMNAQQRRSLIHLYETQSDLAKQIESEIDMLKDVATHKTGISRYWLIMVPDMVASEFLQSSFNTRLQAKHIKQAVYFARTARPGAKLALSNGLNISLTADDLIVTHP